MEIRVYIANLAQYNDGRFVGDWVTLPMDGDELREKIAEILGSDEEIAIHDSEAPFEIGEYQNILALNNIMHDLEDIDVDENVIELLFGNLTFDEAVAALREENYRVWSDCNSMEDVAIEVIEESGLLQGVPEQLQRYFDYESYGRDLGIEGTFFIDYLNAIVVEIIG